MVQILNTIIKKLSVGKPYTPDIENTFNEKKGICYDYDALFAAVLRTQGIPANLVKRYSDNIDGYHSWNGVFY